MIIVESDRLRLRELTLDDAPFIFKLVNEPSWIENIGDKNVHSISDAEGYLTEGPIKSYRENGYGLFLAELKLKGTPVGMCGLVKRDFFEDPDVGFAFLPEYWGLGLASEAARATIDYAERQLGISRVVGVTSLDNKGSMRVLEKVGLRYEGLIRMPGYEGESRFFVPR